MGRGPTTALRAAPSWVMVSARGDVGVVPAVIRCWPLLRSREKRMRDPNGSIQPADGDLTRLAPAGVEGEFTAAADPCRLSTFLLCRIFLEVGATAFGGMVPSLAIIEREFVRKRRVLGAEDVAQAWAVTKLLPGSSLIQVVSFVGYRLGGWSGSVVAAVACVLPPATAMLLPVSSRSCPHCPLLGSMAGPDAAAAVGILLATAYRFGRTAVGSPVTLSIAVCAFGSTVVLGIPAAAVVVAAGLIGVPLLSTPGVGQGLGHGKGGNQ